MNITIVGGGNIGTQFAVHCAAKQHRVTIHTSKPQLFQKQLSAVDATGQVFCQGAIYQATDEDARAFSDADVIFITLPADILASFTHRLLPYIRPGVKIGLIPGTGGGECALRECMEKGAILFGLQRVPAVARLVTYGAQVCSTGYRPELFAAALPKKHTAECCSLLSGIFDMPCTPLPDYLNLTLTPSNPILHTTRLRTLFADYQPGVVYPRIPLFYQEWTDATSRLLIACDKEVQALCRALSDFDLSGVKPLTLHYESDTPEKMTKKISGIPAFQGLPSPQVPVEGGFIPDLTSRYFTADFSYGLSILVQVAKMAGVDAPHMEATLQWYMNLANPRNMFSFAQWGLDDYSAFKGFYLQ